MLSESIINLRPQAEWISLPLGCLARLSVVKYQKILRTKKIAPVDIKHLFDRTNNTSIAKRNVVVDSTTQSNHKKIDEKMEDDDEEMPLEIPDSSVPAGVINETAIEDPLFLASSQINAISKDLFMEIQQHQEEHCVPNAAQLPPFNAEELMGPPAPAANVKVPEGTKKKRKRVAAPGTKKKGGRGQHS
jgi:hypothetical protein